MRDMRDHFLEFLARDAEILRPGEMYFLLGFATECREYGAGDQRRFLERERLTPPDVTE